MKKKKRKVRNKSIIFLLLLVIAMGVFIFIIKMPTSIFKKHKKEPNVPQIEVIDSIDTFKYELSDSKTKYYKEVFNKLKDLLNTPDYNEDEYAELIGKLFLIDFYDLDSKVMKSDVGGIQFVYEPYREDFISGAVDSVYKSVESNVYGDRKQSLPSVKEVVVENSKNDLFKYNDQIDQKAYYLTMHINYTKDLDYPNNVELVLIHNDDKLEIAKMETK